MEVKLKQLIVILLIIFVSCGNVKAFDYLMELHGKREIIKSYPLSEDKRYLNFILEGTFTDNLGNYGIWDSSSIVTLQNKNVINLQGYGKRVFQNNEILNKFRYTPFDFTHQYSDMIVLHIQLCFF